MDADKDTKIANGKVPRFSLNLANALTVSVLRLTRPFNVWLSRPVAPTVEHRRRQSQWLVL